MSKSVKSAGFTVVELLVVVAVVAVLASLLFPVYTTANRYAHQTTCLGNLSQIAKGLTLYAVDHSDLLPVYQTDENAPPLSFFSPLPTLLRPYGVEEPQFLCPQDKMMINSVPLGVPEGARYFDLFGTSYEYNLKLTTALGSLTSLSKQKPTAVLLEMEPFHGSGPMAAWKVNVALSDSSVRRVSWWDRTSLRSPTDLP